MSINRSVVQQQVSPDLEEAVRRQQEGVVITDEGDRPGKEQQAAESTTARVDLGQSVDPDGSNPNAAFREAASDLTTSIPGSGQAGQDVFLQVKPSEEELREQLGRDAPTAAGITGRGSDDGVASGSGGGEPPEQDDVGTPFGSKESLLGGDAVSGHTRVRFTEGEGVSVTADQKALAKDYEDSVLHGIGTKLNSLSTGTARQQFLESERGSAEAVKHTSKDGVVTSTKTADGTTIVENKDNGTTTVLHPDGTSHTTRTNPDGSKTTTDAEGKVVHQEPPPAKTPEDPGAAKPAEPVVNQEPPPPAKTPEDPGAAKPAEQPDPDHEFAPLPDDIQAQLDSATANLRSLRPDTGDGVTDPVDDDAFGAGAGGPAGAAPDRQEGLIGNPGTANPEPTAGGSARNPDAGTVDPAPGDDVGAPGTGPEDDPFAGQSQPVEPPAETDSAEEGSGDGAVAVPFSDIESRVDDPAADLESRVTDP